MDYYQELQAADERNSEVSREIHQEEQEIGDSYNKQKEINLEEEEEDDVSHQYLKPEKERNSYLRESFKNSYTDEDTNFHEHISSEK